MSMTLATANLKSAVPVGQCRDLRRDDLEGVAALFNRVFLERVDPPSAALVEYFERVFFSDPWNALEVSRSCVYETAEGAIGGFFGGHPRRLSMGGRPITAVAVGQYMVDPQLRGQGIARQLAQQMADGPQTITFTSSATPVSSKIFRSVGFWHPRFEGMKWYRQLRRGGMAGLFDRLKHRAQRRGPRAADCSDSLCRPLASQEEFLLLRKAHREHYSLCSDFDVEHTRWTWEMLQDTAAGHRLETCVISPIDDCATAWAVYQVSPGGTARILEFACEPGQARECLRAFYRYAYDSGVSEIIGHCSDPEITAAALENGAVLKDVFSGWAIHCKDREVQQAILNGQVFWSQLDGESWLAFKGR